MFNRFARDASLAVHDACEAAEVRGDGYIGTEHLLLGVLRASGTTATQALVAGGLDRQRALDVLAQLDRDALAAYGIDVEPVHVPGLPRRRKLPFTAGAKASLEGAVMHAMRCRSRRTENRHLVLALLDAAHPDAVAQIIDRAGVDTTEVRRRLYA